MQYINQKDKDLFKFDSMTEMMEWAIKSQFEAVSVGFTGEEIPSWEKLVARSQRSWAEGQYILQEFIQRLKKIELPELRSYQRRTSFNEFEGDEVDYDKLRSGQAYWRQSSREVHSGSKEVTIVTDASTKGSIPAQDILWRGAAALALTHILEEKGYNVELWIVDGTSHPYEDNPIVNLILGCCLKRPQDPIDQSTLLNSMSGWFYRTAFFTFIKSAGIHLNHRPISSIGGVYKPTMADLDFFSADESKIYSSGVFSFNDACDLIEYELRRIAQEHSI